ARQFEHRPRGPGSLVTRCAKYFNPWASWAKQAVTRQELPRLHNQRKCELVAILGTPVERSPAPIWRRPANRDPCAPACANPQAMRSSGFANSSMSLTLEIARYGVKTAGKPAVTLVE